MSQNTEAVVQRLMTLATEYGYSMDENRKRRLASFTQASEHQARGALEQAIRAELALAQPAREHSDMRPEPVGIVAASPGHVSVGWMGGYVPKHNDKLYVHASDHIANVSKLVQPSTSDKYRRALLPQRKNA